MFTPRMKERLHWFGACQVAKYRIAITRADRYFDAGYISKRHLERMINRGRDPIDRSQPSNASTNNERFQVHFRMLVRGLYLNHNPHHLYSAIQSTHWSVSRTRPTIDMDEYFGILYSSFWVDGEELLFHKKWRTQTVKALAEGIFINKAWDRMPILADALEDAGCDHQIVLHRLRTEELCFTKYTHRYGQVAIKCRPPHHRGCYILHKILGGKYHSRKVPC